ncbi:PREDICTED: T-cell surface glycoprotein CD5 [Nipponia nippon]|uniref:T-cell surface glycoprotein CD5 n=1 Tax=Nipponia nippon TaxID=128390 RepID=UPI000510F077|nr:PREDICTED: T-cell surface glycoprotein CD5 [Nipponia nippon]
MAARLPALRLLLLLGMWAIIIHRQTDGQPGRQCDGQLHEAVHIYLFELTPSPAMEEPPRALEVSVRGGSACIVAFLQPDPLAQPRGACVSRAPRLPVHPPTLRFLPAPLCEKPRLPSWGTPVPSGTPGCGDELARAFPAPCGKRIAKGRKAPNACVFPAEPSLQLIGAACRCVGILEVKWEGKPVKTTPEPPPAPPITTPQPTGPARLRLVDGDFGCSGFVELHRQGLWGAVASSPGTQTELATRVCQALSCGTAIDGHGHGKPEQGSHLPVRWEMVESCESRLLLDCFNRTSAQRGKAPAFIICSGSQPQALRRLAAGPTPCEGDMEVFHEGQWRVLCDNRAQRVKWGRQLCQELRCGNLSSSTEVRDPPSMGVTCEVPSLHLCPVSLRAPRTCSRTRVVCQDSKPHPTGMAAGTIVSICLALLLFGILLLICGPPAYRRLMKRISKKKQRQWIGPTGLNQTVSFHRNSTVALRPRAEGQRAQGGDNDYAQPPQKSSYLSAYPALEGAWRASNPPDNSSDSDYDLHSARRV